MDPVPPPNYHAPVYGSYGDDVKSLDDEDY